MPLDAFIGEIQICAFQFPPRNWALCNGQLLPINQNQALFSLLGTTFGGNGQTTFALPDLRGRTPLHFGSGTAGSYILGEIGGVEAVTLTVNELPAHTHSLGAAASASSAATAGQMLAAGPELYAPAGAGQLVAMNGSAITSAGSSQAHDNMQPSLTLSFCIALQGIFPSRN